MSTNALTCQGRSYKSPTALYQANEHSPLVSVDKFRQRIWADRKNNRLSDGRIEDALNLSAKEYNHKYGRRTTWIEVAGERRSQMEVYEGLSARLNGSVVPYATFYQRVLHLLSRLNHARKGSTTPWGLGDSSNWVTTRSGGGCQSVFP